MPEEMTMSFPVRSFHDAKEVDEQGVGLVFFCARV
jgi:hypothetical protein